MPLWRKIDRDVRDTLGEGTMWSARDNALYWVDILAPALNRLSLTDGAVERWAMPEPLGWVVEHGDGGLIGGFRNGYARIGLNPLSVDIIADPEPHLTYNRMNDGKADRFGAIWFGTMDMVEERSSGSLYRIDPDGACRVMNSGYRVPNGPAFSPCGEWLYHTDTAHQTIYRHSLTDSTLSEGEPFIRFTDADGYPDGMTTDVEGYLWVAHWDGGKISRFAPDGTLARAIALPARRITNISFGGEALDRMFVSSAADGLPESEYDGALFEIDSGIVGNPTHQFGPR